jgi:alkylhydroperoxidase family enzyme
MTWIQTIPINDADDVLRAAVAAAGGLLPAEYSSSDATDSSDSTVGESGGVVASHSLIPEALRHAFSTFGALMSPDLPLSRRHHEMIATHVSAINRCRY